MREGILDGVWVVGVAVETASTTGAKPGEGVMNAPTTRTKLGGGATNEGEALSISKGGIQLIRTYCDYLSLFGAYFLMVNARQTRLRYISRYKCG